jgi:voltage-gated potassium channel
VIAFWLLLIRAGRAVWHGWRDVEVRGLLAAVTVLLGLGTLFYWQVEGWTVLDALYFTVVSLTTVGYGDLHPETSVGKVFTMIYLLVGIGLLLAFVDQVAQRSLRRRGGDDD